MARYRVSRQRVEASRRRVRQTTFALLAAMAGVLALLSWLLGGPTGLLTTLIALGLVALLAPQVPAATVMRLYGAQPLAPYALPNTFNDLRELSRRAGLARPPQLYGHPGGSIDAVAVGQGGDRAIALSAGALRALTRRELAAVLAHELSHLAAGDTGLARLGEMIARLAGFLAMFGCVLALFIVLSGQAAVPFWIILVFAAAPLAMSLLQLALSRQREYAADLGAVALMGDPVSLVSALEKIERQQFGLWRRILTGQGQSMPAKILQTHPSIAERRQVLLSQLERVDESTWFPPFQGWAT